MLLSILTVLNIEKETKKNEKCGAPLETGHGVVEDDNRDEDGEELAGGGDDGAGQRSEIGHGQKDEVLQHKTRWILPSRDVSWALSYLTHCTADGKCQHVLNDLWIGTDESHHIEHFTSRTNTCKG